MIERRRAIMSGDIIPDDAIIIAKRSANERELMKVIYAQGWSESPSFMCKSEAEMVTSIGTAFKSNTKITDFSAFKYFISVTTLNNQEFNGCTNLSVIELPLNLTTIGNDAFRYCIFERIDIPDSVTTMYVNTFENCTKLKYLYIGKGFKSYSVDQNKGPHGTLDTIIVHPDNPYMHSPDNCNAVIRKSDNALIIGGRNSFIHPSVKTIFNGAFRSVSGITKLTIPSTLRVIASYSFTSTKLSTIETDSVDCKIGVDFCDATPYYSQPNAINVLCGSFWKYEASKQESDTLTIPDGVIYVTTTKLSDTKLKKIIFPDSTKELVHSVCRNATSLEYIELGSGITTIGYSAFQNVKSDCVIVCKMLAPTPDTPNAGTRFPKTVTFYVPDESLSRYKSGWFRYDSGSNFKPLSELPTE